MNSYNKSPDLRIIIPVLKVVHTGLCVIIAASVTEWIQDTDGVFFASFDLQQSAPAVITVVYYGCSAFVNDGHDISLKILHIEIIFTFIDHSGWSAHLFVELCRTILILVYCKHYMHMI